MKKLNKNIILKILKENKNEIVELFGIKSIGLFGSYVTNSQKKNSDIDIVFETENDEIFNYEKLLSFEDYLKKLVGYKNIELVNKKFMNPIVKYNIKKKSLIIF